MRLAPVLMRLMPMLLLGSAALVPAAAQDTTRRSASNGWFDPTQLPSFTGTVDRYLINPRGETDALVFREGPQVVFPPDIAEAVRRAAPAGRPVVVWGIRARNAPVITMLAYAPTSDVQPIMVDRPYWRLSTAPTERQLDHLAVGGPVRAPYYAPQGEVAGAILEDGTVVMVPPGTAGLDGVRDLLRPGGRLFAEGPGVTGDSGRAVAAERLGDAADALHPIPSPPPPESTPPRPNR